MFRPAENETAFDHINYAAKHMPSVEQMEVHINSTLLGEVTSWYLPK